MGNGSETSENIAEAWRGLGLDAQVIPASRSLERLGPGDIALGRIDVRGSVDGVQPGLLTLLELRRAGVTVLNSPAALLRAHDKLRTARIFAASGVPHPRTEHVTQASPLTTLTTPVVVKPRFGSWGVGVQRCESPLALSRVLARLTERRWFQAQGALVQTLVLPTGHDVRVLVAGGRVVGSISRYSSPNEWRTNISLGGSRHAVVPPARARALALAAAWAVGGDFVGVDLLPDGEDYVVVEVNGAVDFDETYSLPGRSVFEDIAAALHLPLSEHPSERTAPEVLRLAGARPLETVLDGDAPDELLV